jgi:hypothetical protein
MARLLVEAVPRLAAFIAVPVCATWMALHLLPELGLHPWGDLEVSALASAVAQVSRPDDTLLVVGTYSFGPRYYSGRHTEEVFLDRAGYDEAAYLLPVLPREIVFEPDAERIAGRHARWFAIVHRELVPRLSALGTVRLVAQQPHYLLVTNLEGPGQRR